jgi:hypothetical protein
MFSCEIIPCEMNMFSPVLIFSNWNFLISIQMIQYVCMMAIRRLSRETFVKYREKAP